MTQNNNDSPEQEQPFISHLVELRDRLLRSILVVLAIFAALFAFSNEIYTLLAQPLLAHMPKGGSMIATEVASPFLVPLKLTLVSSVFIAIPFLLYQLWAFVAPGLYAHEKRMIMPLLVSSTLLFYAGMAFAYFLVFPLVFGFFTSVAPEGVAVMTDIGQYLDFVLKLFFAFGASFEVPIAIIVLVWMGVVSPATLVAKRPYVIVAAFVIGAVLTPPDVFSQLLLAIPLYLLFEAGVFFSRYFVRGEEDVGAEDAGQEAENMDQMLDRYIEDERTVQSGSQGEADNDGVDPPKS